METYHYWSVYHLSCFWGCCRCQCNNYDGIETVQESVCCKEINTVCRTKELQFLGRTMENEDVPTCIVHHPGFQSGCCALHTITMPTDSSTGTCTKMRTHKAARNQSKTITYFLAGDSTTQLIGSQSTCAGAILRPRNQSPTSILCCS